MSEPSFVADTLDWCNARRAEKGLEPLERLPKGEQREPESCPCGKASGFSVGIDAFWNESEPVSPTPLYVQEFVKAFDNGKLPQYEETQS